MIASGLIIGQAFSALLAATFGLAPLVLLILSFVLFSLIALIAYTYFLEVGSPCFVTGLGIFAAIPIVQLPKFFAWLFAIVGGVAAGEPILSCIQQE